VSYSTDTSEDYSEASGQVFMLGLGGSGSHTIQVMGVITEGSAPVQIGEITIDGIASSIALGGIPAQNAP
jgi:hypothetical protein